MAQNPQKTPHLHALQNWVQAQPDQRTALEDLLIQSCIRAMQGLPGAEGTISPIDKLQEYLREVLQDQIPAVADFLLAERFLTEFKQKTDILHVAPAKNGRTSSSATDILIFAAFTAESPGWLRSLIQQDCKDSMLYKDLTRIPCPRCSAQALVYASQQSPGQLIEFKVQGERARQNVPLALSAYGYSVQSRQAMDNNAWKIVIRT